LMFVAGVAGIVFLAWALAALRFSRRERA